ncbi:hypothetical protein [Gluconobacter albidus]|uniref:Transcriptional regulator n=1 Tax=Gluconobacter albidus TaxID=318683 RepID=A0AAW3QZS2_9PROT|nr:hypothetical protein [Gluconobacter albidus]KXV40257.1 hypothetical protein AD941_04555 [Gluconobacter albidus]GLQ68912.1 hypothetical protein GCM10007866_13630 [Gluconobacter albidus]
MSEAVKAGHPLIAVQLHTLQSLYDAQDIGDEEIAAANRWYREYIFANTGVVDDRPDDWEREKGDVHTWMLGRGRCSARISQIRDQLGLCAHLRLEMMLAREMSFSAIARMIYPDVSEGRARMKVSAQCALILEQLVCAYRNIH